MSKCVMVVDDSSAIRKFVMFALRAQGLTVVTAQDGMDALEKLSTLSEDVDLNMPKLDGYGLVRAIRSDRDYADLPVIILSSLSDEKDKAEGFRIGANAYLVKPFDQKRIQYEISKYIS